MMTTHSIVGCTKAMSCPLEPASCVLRGHLLQILIVGVTVTCRLVYLHLDTSEPRW